MTLIVSVLVEDGIVLAGDSVTTLKTHTAQETPEPTAIKTISHSQNIFPFYERFGIGIWKQDPISGKPVYLAMRKLENKFKAKGICFNTVDEVVQSISEEMCSMDWEEPSIGFFVAGYSGQNVEVVKVFGVEDIGPLIGKEGFGALRMSSDALGCESFGEAEVVDSIKKLYGEVADLDCPPFGQFSLQTAIDYALFLIRTSIEFQKFSCKESIVGETIDVAVVTQLEGFRWVQRQPISVILQREG